MTGLSKWTTADIPDQSGRTAIVTGANSGLGLITARELARAGARVSFVGAVGRDAHGAEVRALMAAEGIDTRHLAQVPIATGTARRGAATQPP